MLTKILTAVAALSLLIGCTAIRENDAPFKEKSLISSGFQPRPADTAKKQAALAALPPYKISARTHKGSLYYIYADPAKQVVYVGGPAQYAAYKKVVHTEDRILEQEMSVSDFTYWGPWTGDMGPAVW